MAYTDYADIDDEITNLGEYIPAGKEALSWVNNKIASAELEINAKLSSRYVTPITPVHDLLKSASLNLTCYYILRQSYTGEDGNTSDWVNEYRKTADELIQLVLDGDVDLGAPTETTSDDQILSATTGLAKTFTDTTYDTSGNVVTTGSLDGF
jgi:phage gp36-like protein